MTETITNQAIRPPIEKVRAAGKIRKLITQLPIIAGCAHAESLSKMFGAAYDLEYESDDIVCSQEDLEIPGNRIQPVNPMNWQPSDCKKARIGWERLVLAEFHCYFEKGRICKETFDEVVSQFGKWAATPDPEIDAILTYEQAITAGFWGF